MSVVTRRVVHYCAQECRWQHSGELSVANMLDAWLWAHRRRNRLPRFDDILRMGHIVEPNKNAKGIRQQDEWVRVGTEIKMDPALVKGALKRLIENTPPLGTLTEHECTKWFKQFEDIHPFNDGNGRTGSILYNWLRGTLPVPIHSPNLWNIKSRMVLDYPEVIMNEEVPA